MEYKLGICDDDYHYVVNLMEYVNSQKVGGLSLVAFSSKESVDAYLANNYLDGILLGTGYWEGEDFKAEEELMIIPLTAEHCCGGAEIYKYQSARIIVQELLNRLNVSLDIKPITGKCFCGVYSPLGRCGKTSLAKGLGVNHKGSLYISLEDFGVRDAVGEEILYHIILQNPKIHSLISQIEPDAYGLREVKGILSYMDIKQLKKEHLIWLKEQLLMGGEQERIIFDIGSAVLSDIDILAVMDRIYVPVLEGQESDVKLHAFKELLRRREYIDIGRLIQYVEVPICHWGSDEMKDFICKGEL